MGLPPGTRMPAGGLGVAGGGGGGGGQTEPFAVVAMSLGVISLVLNCCCGIFSIVLGAVAVVMGLISLSRINQEPDRYASNGKGLAIVGIATGAIGALAQIAMLFFSIGIPLATSGGWP